MIWPQKIPRGLAHLLHWPVSQKEGESAPWAFSCASPFLVVINGEIAEIAGPVPCGGASSIEKKRRGQLVLLLLQDAGICMLFISNWGN
jgi:hypothetical protein